MYLNYINNFRAIAILLIVSGHCIDAFRWDSNRLLFLVVKFNVKNGSALFVFISGYLFQYLLSKYRYREYMIKKVKYVLLPYIIVSLPAISFLIFNYYIESNNSQNYLIDIIFMAIYYYGTGSHMDALWFIPMITIYYVLSPIFKYIDEHPKLYYSWFILLIVSVFTPRANAMTNFIHYLPVYLFGMFCSHFQADVIKNIKKHMLIFIGIYVLLCLSFVFVLNLKIEKIHLVVWYFGRLLSCMIILYVLYRYDEYIQKKISYLASISFGIFFLHSYVIQILRYMITDEIGGEISSENIIYLVLFITTVIILSVALVEVIMLLSKNNSRKIIGC